jgi:hypothetical protein
VLLPCVFEEIALRDIAVHAGIEVKEQESDLVYLPSEVLAGEAVADLVKDNC